MALAPTWYFQPNEPTTEALYGVAFGVYPANIGDTLWVEIERATDSGGTGAEIIARLAPIGKLGGVFVDPRPNDGTTWYYRARHVAPTLDDGPWTTTWISSTPYRIRPSIIDAWHHNGSPSDIAVLTGDIAPLKVFNGDFERGFAFWGYDLNGGTPTLETGADRYKGAASLKLTCVAGQFTAAYMVKDEIGAITRVDNVDYNNVVYFQRVVPGSTIYLRGACKKSVNDANWQVDPSITLVYYDDALSSVGGDEIDWLTETTWTVKESTFTVPSDAYYVSVSLVANRNVSTASCWFDEISFSTGVNGAQIASASITADKIGDGEVSLDKQAGLERAKVHNSANQSVAADTDVALTWDTEDADVGALHESVTHPTRLTVPANWTGTQATGVLFLGQAKFDALSGTAYCDLFVKKNGSTELGRQHIEFVKSTNQPIQVQAWDNAPASGDYYELFARRHSTDGTTYATTADSWFVLQRIG